MKAGGIGARIATAFFSLVISMDRSAPSSRVFAGYASAIVVLLIGGLAYHSARQAVRAFASVQQTERLLNTVRDVGNRVQEAEAGERDYLLTGNESALTPFNAAVSEGDRMGTQLRELAAPLPQYAPRVDTLAYYVRLRLAELGQMNRVRQDDGFGAMIAALSASRTGTTRAEMRLLSDSLYADITRGTTVALMDARRERTGAATLAVLAALIAVVLAIVTTTSQRRQSSERRRTNEELEEQARELQLRAEELEAANAELELTTREMVEHTAEAEANQLRLSGILESATDAIVSYDDEHRIIYINAAAERLLGVASEDTVGTSVKRFIPEDLYEDFEDRMGAVRRARHGVTSAAHRWETSLVRENDTEVPVDVSVSYARAGRQGLFTTIIRDVSQQRELEAQLRQAQKMEAVGRLAGGIAHDFNNLLTVIGASSDFLLQADSLTTYEIRDDVQEIRRATDRAAALTRQLLAFSRRQLVQPEVLELNTVVADMETMLRRLIGEDIRLETSFTAGDTTIRVDRGQVEQVIVNLVVNARDAMPDGGRLTIVTGTGGTNHPVNVPNDGAEYVALSVIDTGVGMDRDLQARIFEPFFTTKEMGQGTGLGLPTVYGIVKQAGGEIELQSAPGEGTEFRLFFPHAEPAPVTETQVIPITTEARGHETVLIVEDEEALRRLARRILESRGYTVLDAANGREAIDVMAKHASEVDLLLSDVVMPVMGGRELAERLLPVYPLLRVLFMSGYTEDMMLRHRIAELGIRVLEKPFTPDILANAVRSALDQAWERRGYLASAGVNG
jgi:PAS domain S-box-containing protein